MKNIILALLFFGFITPFSHAQAPQLMNYQAIVRDASGNPLPANTTVIIRFSIHDITSAGPTVFTDVVGATTNQFGLVDVRIGSGQNLGVVDWGSGPKYLQVETKIGAAPTFTDMGSTQLLSVPYALYAHNSNVGPTGPTGATGAQGTPGLTGPTGATGAQGSAGIGITLHTDTLHLTALQLMNFGSNWVLLSPPPGAGKYSEIISITGRVYPGTIPFTFSGEIKFYLDNTASGNLVYGIPAAALNSSTPTTVLANQINLTSPNCVSPIENMGVSARKDGDEFTTGNGSFTITVNRIELRP